MRTLPEIQNEIKANYIADTTVRTRYSITDPEATYDETFSRFSIESVIIYIVSVAIYAVEFLFAKHSTEVEQREDQMRIGTIGWWRNLCKAFQYGYELTYDSETNLYKYADVDEDSLIIKFAEVREGVGAGVTILVNEADEEGNPIAIPIDSPKRLAFAAYLSKVKIAGMPLTWGSYNPDQLRITLNVVYDPLVLNGTGGLLVGGVSTVESSLQAYLTNLEFGSGVLNKTALLNSIESAAGVVDVYFTSESWLEVSTDDTPEFTAVLEQNIQSYGGSFRLAVGGLNVNYIANV
ncbi:MAG: hypothetical protein RBR24_09335 [Candidatus Carbobacillus sp.]|nr:hypothetical protein [Candidatus Carbobacillus sp.]